MSATKPCVGTPISWLRLERFRAGELDDTERKGIESHLTECQACAACLASIDDDEGIALPPLLPHVPRVPRATKREGATVHVSWRFTPAVAALAVAAGVLLFVTRKPRNVESAWEDPSPGTRLKGGDVSFVLVRDDEESVDGSVGSYRDGDRFKAVVTCPPGMTASWDLVVYERDQAAFPLAAQTDLRCGNAVPMRGAFRTTGHEPMTVCLVWSERLPVDRNVVRSTAPGSLPQASCKALEPAP